MNSRRCQVFEIPENDLPQVIPFATFQARLVRLNPHTIVGDNNAKIRMALFGHLDGKYSVYHLKIW